MDKGDDENEESMICKEKRDSILLKLQEMYTNNLYHRTLDTGNAAITPPGRKEKSLSPIVEDFFAEMYGSRFDESTNSDRFRNVLAIPKNLFRPCERIGDSIKQCEADLNFVQSVVWLKSVTSCMKDVSIEQFHLAFHKQWANIPCTRARCNPSNQGSLSANQGGTFETHLSDDSLTDNEKIGASNDDSEGANSFHSLPRRRCNGNYRGGQPDHQKRIKQGNDNLIEKENNRATVSSQISGNSCSFESSTGNCGPLYNQIIPDTDEECSSSSDMFRDSSWESQEVNEPIENISFSSLETSISKKLSWEMRNGLAAASSSERHVELKGDLINESSVEQISKFTNACSSQKDSFYDTYSLSGKCTPSLICTDAAVGIGTFSSQRIDGVTPYRRNRSDCSTRDSKLLRIDTMENGVIVDNDRQQLCLSPSFRRINENLMETEISRVSSSRAQRKYSRSDTDSMEDTGYGGGGGKRRKLNSGEDSMIGEENEKGKRISSKWLRFTFDALNVDDVASQSVRVILRVLQDERIAREYMGKRCWKDTLEEHAVKAVLEFAAVFEAENKTNACTQEISRALTRTLDRILESSTLNRIAFSTHRISIILEFCTSMEVCVGIINYLTGQLKSYESTLIRLMNGKTANLYDVINRLHIIFYALSICLQKYRLVIVEEHAGELEVEMLPPIVDLWRGQQKFEGTTVEENVEARERRWIMILDNFTVIAMEHFVQFAEKSRKLVSLLAQVKATLH